MIDSLDEFQVKGNLPFEHMGVHKNLQLENTYATYTNTSKWDQIKFSDFLWYEHPYIKQTL